MSAVTPRAPLRPESVVRFATLAVALVMVGATLSHMLQLRRAIHAEAEGRLQSESRMLSRELDRAFTHTRALLDQVDELARTAAADRPERLVDAFVDLTRQQFLLREIALVDAAGRVVASSDRASIGADVSGEAFARAESDRRIRVGPTQPGRNLARRLRPGSPDALPATGFFTVSRAVAGVREPMRAVAVIGTDSLLNELHYLAGNDDHQIAVYRYDGTLLASNDRTAAARTAPHPIFASFLPDRETGGFTDLPGDGRRWLVRFDTSAELPVVVEARTPQAAVVARWERELVMPGAILLLTLAMLVAYTRMTVASLRQRARSQEQALMQERRLRNIVDTAADGIVTIDGHGIVREYNRAAESIFGVPAGEAVGRPLSELLPAEHAGRHQGHVERYLESGEQHVIGHGRTIRTVRRDGRPMELHLSVSEVVDADDHLFTGIVRDVTEVRQAEQRFRTLFERSAEPHLLFDGSGLVDCNDAAAALLHAPGRRALVGLRLDQLAPQRQPGERPGETEASVERSARAAADARRDGVRRLVWTARALDGTEVPVDMTLTPIRLGDSEALLVSWHDISERRRHEDALRRARDAAESAASAQARFLAMMSHELRTPMTGVIGLVELLRESRLDAEQRRYVDVLRNSADALLTVLNDVLDFSKIEAGRLQLERIDFQPAAVAREVVELLSNAASRRGNTIRTDWRDDALPVVCGDPTRLRQVLSNLVGNAIKFTENGTITVSLAAGAPTEGRIPLQLAVRDTGVGIEPDAQQLLFRPFQQADDTTSRRFGGTGLGLTICRHLVQAMGGEIGVDSRPGEGATFSAVLRLEPAQGGATVAPASSRPARASAGALRLLVAEDNPTNRLLIGTRLRRRGHDVTLVENGLQAVDAAAHDDWDLVLMDMQLPELDGADATRAIRALPNGRGRVPVVALTANALPEFRERYMASGLDDCLTKPIDWDALDAVLARLAPGGRPTGRSPSTRTAAAAPPLPVAAARRRIDAADVATQAEELGDDVWRTVLAVYWPRAGSDLDALRAAIAGGDAVARRGAAHSLKGASAGLGFASVAALAAQLEQCDPAHAAALMRRLDDAVARTRADWTWAPTPVA